jgi:hypothetical protein
VSQHDDADQQKQMFDGHVDYRRVAASGSRLGEGDGYPLCQSDSTAGLGPEVASLPVSVDAMQQARIAARP